MTPSHLLDTDTLSHLMRNPQGPVAQRLAAMGEANVCTSVIVAAELRFGAQKLGSEKLTQRVEQLLTALDVLPFDAPADGHYANVRRELELRGEPIGPNDLLIAAQALALGLTVVTGNEREFKRVRGLSIENWIE